MNGVEPSGEAFRPTSIHVYILTSDGMYKALLKSMEHKHVIRTMGRAIKPVIYNGIALGGEVYANLMTPARLQRCGHECCSAIGCYGNALKTRYRWLPGTGSDSHAPGVMAVPPNRQVNDETTLRKCALNNSQVTLDDRFARYKGIKCTLELRKLREQNDAGRTDIEALKRLRQSWEIGIPEMGGGHIGQRGRTCTVSMNKQRRRLGKSEQERVLEKNRRIHRGHRTGIRKRIRRTIERNGKLCTAVEFARRRKQGAIRRSAEFCLGNKTSNGGL